MEWNNWSRGIANRAARGDVPEGYALDLRNLDPTLGGDLRLRSGAKQVYAATEMRGAWQHGSDILLVDEDRLMLFDGDTRTASQIGTVAASGTVSHARLGHVSYINSLDAQLRVENASAAPWGVPDGPAMQVTVGAGGLSEGRYRVAATYLQDGVEGGVAAPAIIDLQEGSSLTISLPPMPADCEALIYLSDPNGRVLYRQAKTAATQVQLNRVAVDGVPLATEGLVKPPYGSMMADSEGMLGIADGDLLYVSEPLMPHLFNPVRSVYQYPGGIRFLIGTSYGFVIGHERGVSLLRGAQSDQVQSYDLDDHRPYNKAVVSTHSGAVYWLTERGPTQFTPSPGADGFGSKALASDHFVMGRHDEAAVGVLKYNGLEMLLVAPKDKYRPNSLVSTDYYETDVVIPDPPTQVDLINAGNDFASRVFTASTLGF